MLMRKCEPRRHNNNSDKLIKSSKSELQFKFYRLNNVAWITWSFTWLQKLSGFQTQKTHLGHFSSPLSCEKSMQESDSLELKNISLNHSLHWTSHFSTITNHLWIFTQFVVTSLIIYLGYSNPNPITEFHKRYTYVLWHGL